MKRVIPFTNFRYFGFGFSSFLIIAGIVGTILRGGFNIGIDFAAGLSEQVQIAPVAFEVVYAPKDKAEAPTLSLSMSATAINLTAESPNATKSYSVPYADYRTIGAVEQEIGTIPDVKVIPHGDNTLPSSDLVGISTTVQLSSTPFAINIANQDANHYIHISQVREALSSLGRPLIQSVGAPAHQQFLIRVEDKGKIGNFQSEMTKRITQLLGAKFGARDIVIKQSAYVGPRFSQNLAQQAITLTVLALVLIMVYIWIRFKLSYAISAMIATIHDPIIMVGFIGTFHLEVQTATIAAILTIVGYSLNDTIVVLDRIRENRGLMRDTDLRTVIDTSVTQVLHRTVVTSFTTFLAVIAILIFTRGSIQEFSLNMVIGIVIGTYSSIFVAAQILLLWENARDKRKKIRDAIKYGTRDLALKMAGQGGGGEAVVTADGTPAPAISGVDGDGTKREIVIPRIERKLHGKRRRHK